MFTEEEIALLLMSLKDSAMSRENTPEIRQEYNELRNKISKEYGANVKL